MAGPSRRLVVTEIPKRVEADTELFAVHRCEPPRLRGAPPVAGLTVVLMLAGISGVGKTTLINLVANMACGVEFEEEERLELIGRETDRSQSHSQTSKVNAYFLPVAEGALPGVARLVIIDTPGLGDTRGADQSRHNIECIRAFLESGHVRHLTGLGVVVKASDSRWNAIEEHLRGVFDMMGREAPANVVLPVSFWDCLSPAGGTVAEQALPENLGPLLGGHMRFFRFNNAVYRASPYDGDPDDTPLKQVYWDRMRQNVRGLVAHLATLAPMSLEPMLRVMRARKTLVEQRAELLQRMDELATLASLLTQHQEALRRHGEMADATANHTFSFNVRVPNVEGGGGWNVSFFGIGFGKSKPPTITYTNRTETRVDAAQKLAHEKALEAQRVAGLNAEQAQAELEGVRGELRGMIADMREVMGQLEADALQRDTGVRATSDIESVIRDNPDDDAALEAVVRMMRGEAAVA